MRVALDAGHASVRFAAAERVHSAEPLRRLLKGSMDKDRGVARLARERLDAIHHASKRQHGRCATEGGRGAGGPAWSHRDGGRRTRSTVECTRAGLRCRPTRALGRDRPSDEGAFRPRSRGAARTHAVRAASQPLAGDAGSSAVDRRPACAAGRLASLRADAAGANDTQALARLDRAEQQIVLWEQAAPALAAAEALVVEAEQLAADTTIDDAQLPTRWQALDAAGRIPALTQRFEAAVHVIEQRRDAYVRANQQEQVTARHQLHAALHEAEQALAPDSCRRRAPPPIGRARSRPTRVCCRSRRSTAEPRRAAADRPREMAEVRTAERPRPSSASAPKPLHSRLLPRPRWRAKCSICAPSGRSSTSSTPACPSRCGNASMAPASGRMHLRHGTSRSRPRCTSRPASSARTSSQPQPRTCRRCSARHATGARSNAGCARPSRPGAAQRWAASTPAHGRSSTHG